MPQRNKLFLLLFSLSVIKILFLLFFTEAPHLFEAHDMAVNLLEKGELFYVHNGKINYTYQFPVYPFLVFIVYKLLGIHTVYVLIAHILLVSAAAFFMYYIFMNFLQQFELKNFTDTHKANIAFVSVIIFMLHPAINFYALKNIHPLPLDIFLMTASLFFMFHYFKRRTIKRLLLYALVLGISILDRATLIFLIIPFILLLYKNSTPQKVSYILLFVCLFSMLFPLGWMTRNFYKTGTATLNSSTGQNLWIGILNETEGTAIINNKENYYAAFSKEDKDQLMKIPAAEEPDFFKEKYFKKFKKDPLHVGIMFFVKLKNFWLFSKNIGATYSVAEQKYILLYQVFYVALISLAITGTILVGKKALLILSFPVALSFAQAFFYIETRHRFIVEPFIILLAVVGLHLFFRKLWLYRKIIKGS